METGHEFSGLALALPFVPHIVQNRGDQGEDFVDKYGFAAKAYQLGIAGQISLCRLCWFYSCVLCRLAPRRVPRTGVR
jgi:hypothetical protein